MATIKYLNYRIKNPETQFHQLCINDHDKECLKDFKHTIKTYGNELDERVKEEKHFIIQSITNVLMLNFAFFRLLQYLTVFERLG